MRNVRVLSAAAGLAAVLVGFGAHASTFNILHSFCRGKFDCPDGKNPSTALVSDRRGNLYGTASAGGDSTNSGVVFELIRGAKKYHYRVIHSFECGETCVEGGVPVTPLIVDKDGNLYGTAVSGGAGFGGTVFELSPNPNQTWNYKVLINFCSQSGAGCLDGMVPESGLTYAGASSGAPYDGVSPLFGTTLNGSSPGMVYRLTQSGGEWTGTELYKFCQAESCADGAFPVGQIAVDAAGQSVYGMTNGGGGVNGSGVAYKVTVATGAETVLHTLCSKPNCTDGSGAQGGVTLGDTLLGTTPLGGKADGGTVFSLDLANGKEKVIYSFCKQTSCTDGQDPTAPVVQAGANLIGTALGGSASNGVIYQIAPDGSETVLHTFCQEADCKDGSLPVGVLVDGAGTIFGVTEHGGHRNGGLIYQLTALP